MPNFIEFYELAINALLMVRSEMLPFSGNNQSIKMFGVPRKHFAIHVGYVHNDNLPLRNIALQYVIQNNCMTCLVVFSDDFLHFLKIKEKQLLNSPKLSCGFKMIKLKLKYNIPSMYSFVDKVGVYLRSINIARISNYRV